jgi:uncharacterized membrane protein (DUF485 family)
MLGFLVMHNPMRLARLVPWAKGYYQRLTLDRWQRLGMRTLGVFVCLFGLVVLTATSDGLLKQPALGAVSDALLTLMGLLFCATWVFGTIVLIIQLIRGRALDYLGLWRRGIELGPVDVYPPITPAMQKEAKMFTLAFSILLSVTVCIGLYRR